MESAKALAALFALLICSGCIAQNAAREGNAAQAAVPEGKRFAMPESKTEYTATYSVTEGKSQSQKTVWRAGDRMRVDLSGEGGTASIYLLGSEGYSCLRIPSGAKCYNVTAALSEAEAGGIVDTPDFTSGIATEGVDIGSVQGKCYLFSNGIYGERKMCFTKENITAYDEETKGGNVTRVEYATEISYSADQSAFLLPAAPETPPQ